MASSKSRRSAQNESRLEKAKRRVVQPRQASEEVPGHNLER